MTHRAFETRYDNLPSILPVFPLKGVSLLPQTRLDLNIFEPRYLGMTIDALSNERLIGMVQPKNQPTTETVGDTDPIQSIGCAGRIVSFNETDDGRLVISLLGVLRFQTQEELELHNGYRRVKPNWDVYKHDLQASTTEGLHSEMILESASRFLSNRSLDANLDALKTIEIEALVNMLSVHLPFTSEQKQTLLCSDTIADRYQMLVALCEHDIDNQQDPIVRH